MGPVAKFRRWRQSQFLNSLVSEEDESNYSKPEDYEAVGGNRQPALSVKNLWKVFPPEKTNGSPVRAVRGLNLDVYSGEITCLLGHNGAGKSTFLSNFMGLLKPTAGEIKLFDFVCPITNTVF